MENSLQHIDTILSNNLHPIFAATWTIIEPMAEGDRKHVNIIQSAVALAMNADPKKTAMFVNYYLHQIETFGLGYVVPGANGGFVRGPRPVKATPPTPKSEPSEVVNAVINESLSPTESSNTENPVVEVMNDNKTEEKIAV